MNLRFRVFPLTAALGAVLIMPGLGCRPAFSDAESAEHGVVAESEHRAPPAADDYTFTISSDPAVVVLRVAQVKRPVYERFFHVHGDGRVEMEERLRGRVRQQYSLQLGYDEVAQLVRRAIEHGLADYRHRGLLSRRIKQTCNGGVITDHGGTQFTLRLDSYARDEQSARVFENKIYVYALEYQPRFCPGLTTEYEHLLALEARVEEYWSRAREGQR